MPVLPAHSCSTVYDTVRLEQNCALYIQRFLTSGNIMHFGKWKNDMNLDIIAESVMGNSILNCQSIATASDP